MIDALICFTARRFIYCQNPFECFCILHNIKRVTFLDHLKRPGKKKRKEKHRRRATIRANGSPARDRITKQHLRRPCT